MIEYALRSTFNDFWYTKNAHYVEWYDWCKFNDRAIVVNDYNNNSLWIFRINGEIFGNNTEEFQKALVWEKLSD